MMRAALLFTAIALSLASACSTPAVDARVSIAGPDRAAFPPVAAVLEHRCGSLDCHGSIYRNMKLYGEEGLRLAPSDRAVPVEAGKLSMTAAELDTNYASVVGLEPEIMNAVVAAHGDAPQRLSLIRKSRGMDHHQGGTLAIAGADQDVCMTSWLSGATNTDACARALLLP